MTAVGIISLDGARALARADAAVPRVTGMLRSISDGSKTAIGEWSIGDVAAHLAMLFELYPPIVRGQPSPVTDLDDIPALSAAFLAADPQRDVSALAGRIEGAWAEYERAVDDAGHDQIMTWHGGIKLPVAALTAILLGELIVHGRDIAVATGKPWRIEREDAALTLNGVAQMLPHFLTPEGKRARESFRLRVRGGDRLTLRFRGGSLDTSTEDDEPVDCKMSVDPVAFLLVGYGRTGQGPAILKGQMLAYGRKPWLAFRLQSYLRNP